MSVEDHLNLMKIIHEDGVRDLPTTKCKGAFAKALKEERKEGHTTDKALAFLDEAILLEAAA